ncbi:MAG: hypothetical protein LQ341_005460, partial [Variospora aurantia]
MSVATLRPRSVPLGFDHSITENLPGVISLPVSTEPPLIEKLSSLDSTPLGSGQTRSAEAPNVSSDIARSLAHRASLGRIVALVANERLVQIYYNPNEQLYYISALAGPSTKLQVNTERFVISGSPPFRSKQGKLGNVIPALMHESNIQPGRYSFQQQLINTATGLYSWIDVDVNVTANYFVDNLRSWTGWDIKLTKVFAERIRCSTQYLADAYAENRLCPTRQSDYITWEQSIVEANGHPLHKCRMPVDPRTQATKGVDFKHATIAFMAVKRGILDMYGELETELEPLNAAAGINSGAAIDVSEIVIPVHDFQVKFLLSLPQAAGQLRVLPQKISALAQSSTRTLTVPSLPGIGIKLSLSLIIGDNIRIINSRSAFNAVQYWTAGMLDPSKLVGLRETPLEILPEVACANGLGDHLAVMVRWDPYHSSRPPVDADIGYAVAGALGEPAVIGERSCVAESVFELTTSAKRLDFLRNYTKMYFQCFLKPLFHNGLLIDAHGQNSLLRFSRTTSQLLGFSARDMSGTRFNRMRFERSTGIAIDARMSNHDLGVSDLLERAYFIFFVVHLWPLIIALDLHRSEPITGLDSTNALQGWGNDAKAIDLTGTNGWAVVAHELDKALMEYQRLEGEDAASTNA